MKVEIYSDIACPWCAIGKRRFRRALEAFERREVVAVVHRPFQLDPTAPRTPVPLLTYLERRYGAMAPGMLHRVEEAAAVEGLVFDWDRALAVNTFLAHRLLLHAAERWGVELQDELLDRLYRAHFSEGRDVGSRAVLAEIAGEAGGDAAEATAYLASDAGEEELRQALDEASLIGVRSVPTFVFDGERALAGAQPVGVLLGVMGDTARG